MEVTRRRIISYFYYVGIKGDVQKIVNECEVCQKE